MTVGGGGVEAGGHPAVARPISITPAARTGIAPSATTAPDDGERDRQARREPVADRHCSAIVGPLGSRPNSSSR